MASHFTEKKSPNPKISKMILHNLTAFLLMYSAPATLVLSLLLEPTYISPLWGTFALSVCLAYNAVPSDVSRTHDLIQVFAQILPSQ